LSSISTESHALADRLAIADIIHLYARAMRERRPLDGAALFTNDGVFEIRDGMPGEAPWRVRTRLEGRPAIEAYLTRGDGTGTGVCPLIHNILVEMDGDTARANAVMQTQIIGTSHMLTGEYHDDCVRVDGAWRFAVRRFTIFGPQPAPPESAT
jgi:hypothetical protein